MDLRLSPTPARPEEHAAVDALLGPPDSGWTGGIRHAERDGHAARGGHAARAQRHLLLPALHAVQDRMGWISPEALNYICQRLTIPPAEAYGVASFYALFALSPQPAVVAHVCDDLACLAKGADRLCAELTHILGPPGTPDTNGQATWHHSPCLGLCERAPAAAPACGRRRAAGTAPGTCKSGRGGYGTACRSNDRGTAHRLAAGG